MDVNTSSLNGELEEVIYIEQPEGFVVPGKEEKHFMVSSKHLNNEIVNLTKQFLKMDSRFTNVISMLHLKKLKK